MDLAVERAPQFPKVAWDLAMALEACALEDLLQVAYGFRQPFLEQELAFSNPCQRIQIAKLLLNQYQFNINPSTLRHLDNPFPCKRQINFFWKK